MRPQSCEIFGRDSHNWTRDRPWREPVGDRRTARSRRSRHQPRRPGNCGRTRRPGACRRSRPTSTPRSFSPRPPTMANSGASPSCSPIWSTPPRCRPASNRKPTARWWGDTATKCCASSTNTKDTSATRKATDCSPSSAIPRRTRTMSAAPFRPDWTSPERSPGSASECSRRFGFDIDVARRHPPRPGLPRYRSGRRVRLCRQPRRPDVQYRRTGTVAVSEAVERLVRDSFELDPARPSGQGRRRVGRAVSRRSPNVSRRPCARGPLIGRHT